MTQGQDEECTRNQGRIFNRFGAKRYPLTATPPFMEETLIELGIVDRTLKQLGFTSTLAKAGESLILFVIVLLVIGRSGAS